MDVISKIGPHHLGSLKKVAQLDAELTQQFNGRLRQQPALNRQVVSFQANKERPEYRWYKYKEAFSASLVEYLLLNHPVPPGPILDPFAGMGTTLFAAASMGFDADGIELLPIGQQIVQTRLALQKLSSPNRAALQRWLDERPWNRSSFKVTLPVLRITNGAYPAQTLLDIERYIGAWQAEKKDVQRVLRFALLCVLESVSYTRKDGQYLRWDQRSGRRQGTNDFDKGPILPFDEAISKKLREILIDSKRTTPLQLFTDAVSPGTIKLIAGSCLDVLPSLSKSMYSAIITSPPYCNRYDYTRTYALELAILDVDEVELTELRQKMLSCTVENRAKDLLEINAAWAKAVDAANSQAVLQAVLKYLDGMKEAGQLNNPGIARMVRGYFYEMACVVWECARTLRKGGVLFMVNDNVRYGGASIPVDLILSDIAQQLGFSVDQILVLPVGKGNSSQQMGAHGRDQLRKCVYVWRKN
jgi:DNA modification methylase